MGIVIRSQTLHIDYESAALQIHIQAEFFVRGGINSHLKK